jgi:multicomponent Na+:H+ antiporter subunit B
MRSFILRRVAGAVLPVSILLALYLLLRGHDAPGGGFIAGLVTSAAVVLHALAAGTPPAPRRLRVHPAVWVGLLVAASTGLLSTVGGRGFLAHYHIDLEFSERATIHLSTALLFDVGVYLAVGGVMVTALATFAARRG